MKNQPLVSIIIPTFNRAYLIGETLDSVLAQTYQNWECIIVDDGSSDNTDKVVGEYVKKDNRFKYYHRPKEHLPGGNGARNYGFKMSQGEYVNWFDDDDLMLPNKLKVNIKTCIEKDLDYSIDKYIDFKNNSKKNLFSNSTDKTSNNLNPIFLKDYLFHKLKFGTVNLLVIRKLVESLKFNEKLKSGQEYNFFSKVIIQNNLDFGYQIDDTLVMRRIHKNSIQQNQKKNKIEKHSNKFFVYWETYKETKDFLNSKEKQFFIKLFLGHYFCLIASGFIVIKPLEMVKLTRKYKYQTILLLTILYSYILSKLGYHKSRIIYLKLIK